MAAPKSGKKGNGPSNLSKMYLIAYNVLQVLGWSKVLYDTLNYYIIGDKTHDVWTAVNPALLIFQTAAILEIIHVATGLVRSGLLNTTLQVASRLYVVWLGLYTFPTSRESWGVPLLLVAWSVTEIVRYSFYALGLVNRIPHFITWARYTFFYFLYPIGVSGEVLVVFSLISYADKFKPFTIELPNAWNFSYSFKHHFLYASLLVYVFVFPMLYGHMISQRKKVLGGESEKQKSKSKTK